jgi:hypothetical protein
MPASEQDELIPAEMVEKINRIGIDAFTNIEELVREVRLSRTLSVSGMCTSAWVVCIEWWEML